MRESIPQNPDTSKPDHVWRTRSGEPASFAEYIDHALDGGDGFRLAGLVQSPAQALVAVRYAAWIVNGIPTVQQSGAIDALEYAFRVVNAWVNPAGNPWADGFSVGDALNDATSALVDSVTPGSPGDVKMSVGVALDMLRAAHDAWTNRARPQILRVAPGTRAHAMEFRCAECGHTHKVIRTSSAPVAASDVAAQEYADRRIYCECGAAVGVLP